MKRAQLSESGLVELQSAELISKVMETPADPHHLFVIGPGESQGHLDLKPRRERAVLRGDAAIASALNKPLPIGPSMQIDLPPDKDPAFKDNLTPWFNSKLDGPPCRPGVFWTRTRIDAEVQEVGWQLWSGVTWYARETTRERARFSSAVDVAPEHYLGLRSTPDACIM